MTRIVLDDDPRDYLVYREGSGGTVEIVDLAVGSARRRGRGSRLVEALFARVPPDARVWAITRLSNEVAQRFYESRGFAVSGVLRRFYGEDAGADAVLYLRAAGGPV